ncbi:hypothetical protein LCGC14_1531970 [marine sediment metagenome]|uniref:Uncharacterized protein n=1 Tax=marine sediment metagenome TaxID=412755 RepID=A0A0F9JGF9_9ZZZZ
MSLEQFERGFRKWCVIPLLNVSFIVVIFMFIALLFFYPEASFFEKLPGIAMMIVLMVFLPRLKQMELNT